MGRGCGRRWPRCRMSAEANVAQAAVNIILQAREARVSILGLRNRCSENIVTFAQVHALALRIRQQVDITPITNCAVHVSVVGRDLTNFQLCVLDQWTDYEMTPTLIAHFYLCTFEFMKQWPKVLFERPAKACLLKVRGDGFASDVQRLNTCYEEVRDNWWSQLKPVRNHLAGHYDSDSAKLIGALADLELQAFFHLAKDVNDLLRLTASTLTVITTEMESMFTRIAANGATAA